MIKRLLLEELKSHLAAKEMSLIVGARQVGKTTLMKELVAFLAAKGERSLFLNLDYDSDQPHFASQDALIDKLRLELPEGGYVFIDEIQRKEDAGLFLKGVYDRGLDYKFIVSGSGSLELKEKIHESLAGRKRLFELGPVSFLEFVDYKTSYRYGGEISAFLDLEKEKGERFLLEYMGYGGYPRVVVEESHREKQLIVGEILGSYLERDIACLLNVDKTEAFSKMLRLLAAQSGRLLNQSNLAALSGVSVPTLGNYLWYAEKTFIVKRVAPYFTNKVKEITKSTNVYFNDLGLRNYLLGVFGNLANPNDMGFVFQNLVFNILRQKTIHTPFFVNFWRTINKAEVDFVIDRGSDLLPIEVKFSSLRGPVLSKSFRSFIDKYNPPRALLISLDYEDRVRLGDTEVEFIPFRKFVFRDL